MIVGVQRYGRRHGEKRVAAAEAGNISAFLAGRFRVVSENENNTVVKRKKSANHLAVWNFCVNTHTHTHTHTHISRAYFTNYSLIVNTLRKRFSVFPARFPIPFHRQHLTHHIPPSILTGRTTVPYGDLCSMNTMPQVAVARL